MSLQPTIGHLDPACPEAQWWLAIVGNLDVPLRSPVPQPVHVDDQPNIQEVYFVDVTRLTANQVEHICAVMSAKFDVPIEEVRAGIRGEHGLPIRATRLTGVTFDGRILL